MLYTYVLFFQKQQQHWQVQILYFTHPALCMRTSLTIIFNAQGHYRKSRLLKSQSEHAINLLPVGVRQGVGAREKKGQEGYRRWDSRGREVGVVRGQEVEEPIYKLLQKIL